MLKARLCQATAVLLFLLSLFIAAPVIARAGEPESIGARISTLGVGGEFGYKLSSHWSARAIINGYNYNYDDTNDNIHYRGKLKLASGGLQVDYRFAETGPLYVTAGLYANNNKIRATANPTQNTDIGGLTFTPAQIGTLTSNAKFKGAAPYLGIGARWPIGHVAFNIEAGAYFQGKPQVALVSNGTLASDPTYQAALETERLGLQQDLNNYKTYPVVSLGLSYHF